MRDFDDFKEWFKDNHSKALAAAYDVADQDLYKAVKEPGELDFARARSEAATMFMLGKYHEWLNAE